MSPVAWLIIWGVAIAALAFFTIRSWRAGRRGVNDFDRLRHSATADADLRSGTQGPNGFGQTWIG